MNKFSCVLFFYCFLSIITSDLQKLDDNLKGWLSSKIENFRLNVICLPIADCLSLIADDTVLIMNDVCLSSLESKVNSEIKKGGKWLSNNKLTLHLSKTTFMIVSPMNKKLGWHTNFEVKFCGYFLTKSQKTKYLGIFVHDNLKWDAHIKYICYKLSHIRGIFYKMWRLINQDAFIVLYFGFV